MSYSRDLDDYTTDELIAEIRRRNTTVAKGLCPYCEQPTDTHTCKYNGMVSHYHTTNAVTAYDLNMGISDPIHYKK